MTAIEATQWTGCAIFGLAALACAVGRSSPYPVPAIANGLFALECYVGLRHRLRGLLVPEMGSYYAGRGPVQIALLFLALAALLLILGAFRRMAKSSGANRPAGIAGPCTIVTAFLFLVETISLHSVDHILYRPLGDVLAIGWLWICLGGLTVLDAAGDIRR